jgi:hypothetical protein
MNSGRRENAKTYCTNVAVFAAKCIEIERDLKQLLLLCLFVCWLIDLHCTETSKTLDAARLDRERRVRSATHAAATDSTVLATQSFVP